MTDVGRRRIGVAALVGSLAPSGTALADHHHDMAMSENHQADASELSVGVSVEAARFDTGPYVGSYEGITPSLGWLRGRFGASATISLYHLDENGLGTNGLGDTMLGGHATVLATDAVQTGVALHVMLPTGSELENLGMGHVMAMPSAWGSWRARPVTVMATAGYGRALTGLGGAHHDHGAAPLVDPMNMQELTWSAGAGFDVGHGFGIDGRALGGIPIGSGVNRVIAGAHVAWSTQRVSTGCELQLGLAGDPFTIRAVVDTALRF